ncbi:MAG: L-2-hydroxyglutarate oxidase [Elusimicrobia bacterium]|nr:L-2-hydroxyglutarate oxidase [Elusimicrobiota bacterium]
MEYSDFLIVGAGIIGLAVAREIRQRHPNARIIVLEKEARVGCHASGRNSGVLHSGIYYSPGTLKAKFCAEGARQMLAFARENGVTHRVGGKVILASGQEDLPGLERLEHNARANGIRVLRLTAEALKKIEPHAAAGEGIHCLDTAVVDAPGVMRVLAHKVESSGTRLFFGEEVIAAEDSVLITRAGRRFHYEKMINCAGAHADQVARFFGLAKDHVLVPFKGLYWKLRKGGDHWVRESLYPVPDLNFPFLGIHLTRGVSGDVYVGPTAIPALGRENYGLFQGIAPAESLRILSRLAGMFFQKDATFRRLVNREVGHYVKSIFLKAVQRLVPNLSGEDLVPSDNVGIRPQLVRRSGGLEMDFHIEQTDNSLHVLNAISPAFTCSLAFAGRIVDGLEKRGSEVKKEVKVA